MKRVQQRLFKKASVSRPSAAFINGELALCVDSGGGALMYYSVADGLRESDWVTAVKDTDLYRLSLYLWQKAEQIIMEQKVVENNNE